MPDTTHGHRPDNTVRLTTRPHLTIRSTNPLAEQVIAYDRELARTANELGRRATRLATEMTRLADTAHAAATGQPHHTVSNRGEIQGSGPGIDLLCARLVDTGAFLDALLAAAPTVCEHHPTNPTPGRR